MLAVLAALLTMPFSQVTQPASMTRAEAVANIEKLGYVLESTGDRFYGSLRKGMFACQFGLYDGEVSDAISARRKTVFLRLDFKFLLDSEEPLLANWCEAQDEPGWKMTPYVTGVLVFSQPRADLRSPDGLCATLRDAERLQMAFRTRFRATQVDAHHNVGHLPRHGAPLNSLCFGELTSLVKRWGWSWKPNSINAIPRDPIAVGGSDLNWYTTKSTIDGISASLTCQGDPWNIFGISAEVPLDPGANGPEITDRLNKDQPGTESWPSPTCKRIRGSFARGYYYTYSELWLLDGMTVGEFRREVEAFALKIKGLPHR